MKKVSPDIVLIAIPVVVIIGFTAIMASLYHWNALLVIDAVLAILAASVLIALLVRRLMKSSKGGR